MADANRTLAVLGAGKAAEAWTAPLSTRGRYIVDADGRRFRLKSANWDGAQGSWNGSGDLDDPANHHGGQDAHGIPVGLDRVRIATLLDDFRALGLNSIRLPFSNEMLHATAPVPDAAVAANPQLRGRTPLQVFDAVVSGAEVRNPSRCTVTVTRYGSSLHTPGSSRTKSFPSGDVMNPAIASSSSAINACGRTPVWSRSLHCSRRSCPAWAR